MSKKAFVPPRLAPLQRVVAEIVTDPAEIAAMEKIHKQQKRKQREKDRPAKFAPLQRVVAEIVTDPAEIAAMEKIRKQQKRKQKEEEAIRNRKGAKAAPRGRATRKSASAKRRQTK